MRTRAIAQPTAAAIRHRVDHDGVLRTAVALNVAPRTLARALRGEPLSFGVAARLESATA